MVNIEDAWDGDVSVAAVNYPTASFDPRALTLRMAGLGGCGVDDAPLGEPLASFEAAA